MQTITSSDDLESAIQILEIEQEIQFVAVVDQGALVYSRLKPLSLLKNTLIDVAKSPYLIDNIVGAVLGLATGYVSRKIMIGKSSNVVRKILGSILQVGVTKIITQNSDKIKYFTQGIISKLLHKKEV